MLTKSLCHFLADNMPVEQIDPRTSGRNALVASKTMHGAFESRLGSLKDRGVYSVQLSSENQLEDEQVIPNVWIPEFDNDTDISTKVDEIIDLMANNSMFAMICKSDYPEKTTNDLFSLLFKYHVFELWYVDFGSGEKCVVIIGCKVPPSKVFLFRSILITDDLSSFVSKSLVLNRSNDVNPIHSRNKNHGI